MRDLTNQFIHVAPDFRGLHQVLNYHDDTSNHDVSFFASAKGQRTEKSELLQ